MSAACCSLMMHSCSLVCAMGGSVLSLALDVVIRYSHISPESTRFEIIVWVHMQSRQYEQGGVCNPAVLCSTNHHYY
jgi:hypothetical protein